MTRSHSSHMSSVSNTRSSALSRSSFAVSNLIRRTSQSLLKSLKKCAYLKINEFLRQLTFFRSLCRPSRDGLPLSHGVEAFEQRETVDSQTERSRVSLSTKASLSELTLDNEFSPSTVMRKIVEASCLPIQDNILEAVPVKETVCDISAYETLTLTAGAIRTAKVAAQSSDQPVECIMSDASTRSQYLAVSYAWGPETDPCAISIGSDSTSLMNQEIEIRQNLSQFLRVASRLYPETALWVDALCINQRNVRERNHQVQQMGLVYSSAKRVLIWLGTGDPDCEYTMATIASGQNPRPQCLGDNHKQFWPGLHKICTHDYWTRLWIAQEVLLAQEIAIVYGNIEIPWSTMSEIVLGYSEASWFLEDDDGGGSELDHAMRNTSAFPFFVTRKLSEGRLHAPIMFTSLLRRYCSSRCQDARDRVFGLLSLAKGGHEFKVDYNLTPIELFCRTWSHFNTNGSAELAYLLLTALELELDAVERIVEVDKRFRWETLHFWRGEEILVEMINPNIRRPLYVQTADMSSEQCVSHEPSWMCYSCDQIVHLRLPSKNELICCLVRSGFPNHIIFAPYGRTADNSKYFADAFTVMDEALLGETTRETALEQLKLRMVESGGQIAALIEMSCAALVCLVRQLHLMTRWDTTAEVREELFSCTDPDIYRFVLSLAPD